MSDKSIKISASDLLPCPFCGGKVKLIDYSERPEETWGYDTYIKISCDNNNCSIKPTSERVYIFEYEWGEKGHVDHHIPGRERGYYLKENAQEALRDAWNNRWKPKKPRAPRKRKLANET
jgi:hypothetical protein